MNWRALGTFFRYFFLFNVNKKRQLIKKMASGKFEEKLQFLCFDLKRIKHFLLFCKDNLPQPGVSRGKPIPLLGAKENVPPKNGFYQFKRNN